MTATSRDYAAAAAAVPAEGPAETRMRAVADALWAQLEDHDVSWVGFYIDQPGELDDRRMVLGPHRDKPACSPIGVHGVCGQSLLAGATRIVDDVATLGDDYVACDPRDRSEIVIPLLADDGVAWAVLDLDSWSTHAFDETDEAGLKQVLRAAGFRVG